MMKKIIGITLILGWSLFSCQTQQKLVVDNITQFTQTHQRVAILPFKVTFSEAYKNMSQRGKRQGDWKEQERVAGLDLQKSAFSMLSKRANKKNYGITVQDFLTTNKILQSENIRFSELAAAGKGQLARILGVDAVIWGETDMQMDPAGWRNRNGISTTMALFDAKTEQKLWQQSSFADAMRRFDTPQSLSENTVNNLINALPYKKRESRED